MWLTVKLIIETGWLVWSSSVRKPSGTSFQEPVCALLPNSTFTDIRLVAWNQLWRESLQHRNQTFSPGQLVVKHLPTHHYPNLYHMPTLERSSWCFQRAVGYLLQGLVLTPALLPAAFNKPESWAPGVCQPHRDKALWPFQSPWMSTYRGRVEESPAQQYNEKVWRY